MEEKVFFNEGNVSVSNSRFIVDGQTYAINNVTSVKNQEIPANRSLATFFFIIGVICIIAGGGGIAAGIVFIIAGAFAWKAAKPSYTVKLNTSAGENQALTSKDKAYIEKVISALNSAIISRG